MKEPEEHSWNKAEQVFAQRNDNFDLPDDILSTSDHDEEPPTPATERRLTTTAKIDPRFLHIREHNTTSTVRAHLQIYVVTEQIIHGKSTWCSTLCAFDNLHSANTQARTHAIFQHAKGDASIVQVSFRNGYGTWTSILETGRGCITKSVFVNATVLQHLATPPITPTSQEEKRPVPEDRILSSRVTGSLRVRRIQTLRSTDSIRMECERSDGGQQGVEFGTGIPPKLALHENSSSRNQVKTNMGASKGVASDGGEEVTLGKENTVRGQCSIDDLRDFASLHTLF